MQIFDVGDVFAHCCDGFATPKLFVYPLCRLGGAFGVFEMFICRVGGANYFLSVGGCMSYLNKTCCGLVSIGIALQLFGGVPLQQHWSAIDNNCRWIWQGIADLLSINVGGTIFAEIRLWCGRCSVCVLFNKTRHCIC